jgi:hypothetical protein
MDYTKELNQSHMLMILEFCLTAKNNEELKNKINCMLDYMTEWFSANGLALNMEKTNIINFTSNYHKN